MIGKSVRLARILKIWCTSEVDPGSVDRGAVVASLEANQKRGFSAPRWRHLLRENSSLIGLNI